jgi:hypothetical protein
MNIMQDEMCNIFNIFIQSTHNIYSIELSSIEKSTKISAESPL